MNQASALLSEYEELKRQLLKIGLAIPGTIHAQYALCGSKYCECVKDKSKRHGPYYRWHHRSGDHQVSIGLDEHIECQFEEWIKNKEELDAILQRMLEVAAAYAQLIVAEKKRNAGELKIIGPLTRGK